MSRLYTRNSRGRQPLLASTPRFSRSKDHVNDANQQSGDKRRRPSGKYATTISQAKRRRAAASTASATSSADSDAADEASDEDSETDEEPAFVAPFRKLRKRETGHVFSRHLTDEVSLPATNESMFGDFEDYYEEGDDPTLSPEENRKAFEKKVFAESDDDNDDVYKAVDDISDSEDDAKLDEFEEQQLITSLSDDDDDDNDEQDLYLNQIDGLSAYGFGDDSDGTVHFPPSPQGSDSATEPATERRVRFDIESAAALHMKLSNSPTIARALLPSALPDPSGVFGGPAAAPPEHERGPLLEEEYDSDLTDDCLPEEAHHSTPSALLRQADEEANLSQAPSSPTKKSFKKPSRRRGPPRGVFIDDGDKASGILDASGKIMLITHPHLLGEEFAKRYGASQTSSPDMGFEELIDESDAGDAETQDNPELMGVPNADIMLASLNSITSDPAYLGQATGPHEAFFPAEGFEIGDYSIDPDDLEEDFNPDAGLGEDVIDIHDVLEFDDDSNDSDSPTSPIFMPPNQTMPGFGNVNNEFAHLTNENVTAFRRNADPNFAAFSNIPAFPDFSSALSTPSGRRKRKVNESPYTSSHYKGVTPVQRMRDPASSQTPETVGPPSAKRRRIMI